MGKVVAVVNRKGGVGKTTLTVALADTLISEKAKDVCVLDMDPQASRKFPSKSAGIFVQCFDIKSEISRLSWFKLR